MTDTGVARRLAAIVATDVVGYSRLMHADEEGTLARVKRHLGEKVDPCVAMYHGRIVKTIGDGVLAEFSSATDAVRCVLRLHDPKYREDRVDGQPLRFRTGIGLGDVMVDETNDIFGDAVNIASRIQQLAEADEILATVGVRDYVHGKVEAEFEFAGERRLKNIAEPVAVYRVIPTTGKREPVRAVPSLPAQAQSVAVLPFRAISRDDSHTLLADGLTEEVTTRLARVPGFFVVARYSMEGYASAKPDPGAVARELGVRYIVEGSLRPLNGKLRINARLVDASNGGLQLWAGQFDTGVEPGAGIEDEIAQNIVNKLGAELKLAEVRLARTRHHADLTAWSHMRLAYAALLSRGWNEESFEEAASHCQRAIALDAEFALAHAVLALTLGLGKRFALIRRASAEADAVAEAERAMALAPDDSEVLGYAGCALSDVGYARRGTAALERAIEANPSNAQAWAALGASLLGEGRAEEGVERMQHGLRLSPRDPRLAIWRTFHAEGLLRIKQLEEALAEAQAACDRDHRFFPARIVLAAVLLEMGRQAEAIEALKEAVALHPTITFNQAELWIGRSAATALRDAAPQYLPLDPSASRG